MITDIQTGLKQVDDPDARESCDKFVWAMFTIFRQTRLNHD